ncbi:hypothetical protein [Deinococcus hopiensis]|uniref:hypothetical protein n=1 Tax=Deinococcus hopiensis TaxID=309885 RepID=UPI000A0026FA
MQRPSPKPWVPATNAAPDRHLPFISVKAGGHDGRTTQNNSHLGPVCPHLVEEDPTLRLASDPDSGRSLVSGKGEFHPDVVMERVTRKQGVIRNQSDSCIWTDVW